MGDVEMDSIDEDPFDCDGDDEFKDKSYTPDAEKRSQSKKLKKPKNQRANQQMIKATLAEKKNLAKLVEGKKLIWDLKDPMHCNKFAVIEAWKCIAAEMNRSGEFGIALSRHE